MEIEPIDVAQLEVPGPLPDLRRDIHVFVQYVRGHEVKRSHRDNGLGKADAQRLAKLMSNAEVAEEVEEKGFSAWLRFVDCLALTLGFVDYDTEGHYAGYTSRERTFPDNYIKFLEKPYQQFLAAKAAKQETTLLETLFRMGEGRDSEFYRPTVSGRLDGFSTWASATGVVPLLDFAAARRFLVGQLAKCPTGQWLSTRSLVQHLKKNHRYFLIPAKPQFKNTWDAKQGRYDCFHESKQAWGNAVRIQERDKDAFERVEGRYVERFLEGIPHLLGYLDVAYAADRADGFSVARSLERVPRQRAVGPGDRRADRRAAGDCHAQLRRPPARGDLPGGRVVATHAVVRDGFGRHSDRPEVEQTEGRGRQGRRSQVGRRQVVVGPLWRVAG